MRWAVIVSAGKGVRFGEGVKLLTNILGKPVIWHTIRNCSLSSAQKIILVVPKEHKDRFEKIAYECAGGKFIDSVLGSDTRMGSVRAGLNAVISHGGAENDFVAIHDGARPLCSHKLFDVVFDSAEKNGCAIPAIPAMDTVKIVNGDVIVSTLDRKTVWLAQTPQVFKLKLIISALENISTEMELTDDAQAVEYVGINPRVVYGEKSNIKITTPDDIVIAECLMKSQRQV